MPATDYDRVAYPSSASPTSHPGHLAAIAHLHGLTPPPPATARVLDIGGGDGMNLLSMAEGLPEARFVNVDLAATPVAHGQAIATAAGLANVRVAVTDILDAGELEAPFDYIVAHGVYAWVPAPVREALLALIGRLLAPDGIAFVSYNALPGGHYRLILRGMTLHAIEGIADPDARGHAALAFLKDFAEPRDNDSPMLAPLRSVAAKFTGNTHHVLFHDDLSEHFAPQSLADVATAAAVHGLRFLNDAAPGLTGSGLRDVPLDEAAVLHAAQGDDFAAMCLFHKTLFVRAEQHPARVLDPGRVRDLYLGAPLDRTGANSFGSRWATVTLADQLLVDLLAAAAEAWPARLRVGDHIDDPERLAAVVRLFRGDLVELHAIPFPGAARPGEFPRATALSRALLAMGDREIFSLDQRRIDLADPAPLALLRLLDGTRDRDALARDLGAAISLADVSVDDALVRLAKLALLVA